tara:strand:- start:220 stop:591 length:372 start_codon:yes stop_codon:yes gene_type:complete
MNNKQILTLVFIVFAMFSLSRIRFLDDHVTMGNEVEMHTSIVNDVYKDTTSGIEYQKQKEVRVIAYIPELGEIVNSPRFDIDKHDSYGKMMWWDAVAPGDYLVRITASNDDFSSRKFRYITVE